MTETGKRLSVGSGWGYDRSTPRGYPSLQTKRNTEQMRLNPYSLQVPVFRMVFLFRLSKWNRLLRTQMGKKPLALGLLPLAKSTQKHHRAPRYRKASELEQPDLRFRHKLQYSV